MKIQAQRTLRITIILSFLGWTSMFTLMLATEYPEQEKRFDKIIQLKMDMLNEQTQSIRSWIGAHGGIYAATDDKIKPNALLGKHPERDIVTPSGRHLTLLNSPAFLHQISKEFESESGTRIRFVSDRPINPEDMVDNWEKAGLQALREGKRKYSTLDKEGDQIRYRMLTPMVMQGKCMTCHDNAPWKVGDIAGAISISLDAKKEYQQNQSLKSVILFNHLVIWLVGIVGLIFAGNIWKRLLKSLEHSALIDPLTGVYNRREMMHRMESAIAACERYAHHLGAIMFDIDHFKLVNDKYGHRAGDEVLKAVAIAMQTELRSSDVLSRYGGEEFLVICPHTDADAAHHIAERIREKLERLSLTVQGRSITITLSAGVACYPDYRTVASLIEAADKALYTAKDSGRNRVVIQTAATSS